MYLSVIIVPPAHHATSPVINVQRVPAPAAAQILPRRPQLARQRGAIEPRLDLPAPRRAIRRAGSQGTRPTSFRNLAPPLACPPLASAPRLTRPWSPDAFDARSSPHRHGDPWRSPHHRRGRRHLFSLVSHSTVLIRNARHGRLAR